ncbi:shufflon system plasmid conjugative transfer pilus tip adhesin PilV [Photorhabdus heterorhabditis]|uniref:Secondary type iv prepilin n=1 Tax=Photorhabdus heterorhabditis TaxID=880156 RepID=A0A5B0WBU1_9GAMM|nr:shufflon system plasmid conjugative transfer pilus tip adhesin PilV [Photorhabdus heterorhabditis]KAA1184363.1 shufflon system plasmid conjugative transfer pilus tip adhesin PilV [Photorhabdus heterorhabditis]KOY63686.1 secondary type iv prepilin [Photorhabdus heterorhabditis]MBS9443191.1 shufflon system plasmid conjugative transfer pilus tip adhesin PilV [Photorhabdus heterorhabditis]
MHDDESVSILTIRRHDAGFTLLEVIVALMVLASMMVVGVVYLSRQSDMLVNQVVAGQIQHLGDAVVDYVNDNYVVLSHGATPVSINWAEMIPYLPPGLDQNTVNPLGQKYDGVLRIVMLPNGKKRIDPLIYTVPAMADGKQPNVADHSMKIAQLIGVGGLYLDYRNRDNHNPVTYWNSYGQVNAPESFAGFFNEQPAEIGRIFYAPFMRDASIYGPGTLAGDLLHRQKTGGHPEWNKMETSISMGGNSLDQVDTLSMQGAGIVNGANKIAFSSHSQEKPSYIEQNNDGAIVINPAHGSLFILDGNVNSGNKGILAAGEVQADKNVVVGNNLVINTKTGNFIGGTCPALGNVSMNKQGELLVCQKTGISPPALQWKDATGSGRLFADQPVIGNGGKANSQPFFNNSDFPVLVTASTSPISDGCYMCCVLAVYEADKNGNNQESDLPLVFQRSGLVDYPEVSTNVNRQNTRACVVAFIARPHHKYNITSVFHSSKNNIHILGSHH